MSSHLFRKVSLERLSSPEQLDKLLIIVKLKGWLALLTLILIIFSLFAWSIMGRIPITASGRGILLDPRGLHEVYSQVEGRVSRIYARTGVEVKTGELLLVLENPLLDAKLKDLNQTIALVKESLQDEKKLLEDEQTA